MIKYHQSKKRFKRNFKVLIILIISFLLVIEVFPSVYSTSVARGIDRSVGDFGVLESLDLVLRDKEAKAKSSRIENETKLRLDQIQLVDYPPFEDEIEYQVKSINPPEYEDIEPIIFKSINETTIVNQTTIIDFVLNQPLKYWIFTKSYNISTWSDGMLRPTLESLLKWVNIDVDNNLGNGYEIRVRFQVVLDWSSLSTEIEQILPLSINATIKGGLGLRIERLTNRSFPLEIYVAKSISYEGENYIWITGAKFDHTPIEYDSSLMAETIKFSGLREVVLNAFTQGARAIANATLAEINGPYSLRYNFNSDLKNFNIMAGMIKLENRTLTDKNWLAFDVTPADDEQFVSRSGEVWVDSSNVQAPIDSLRWTSGIFETEDRYKIPVDLRILYSEVRNHLIVADINLINLPQWFTIDIDYTKVVDGKNVTVLDYAADDVLSIFNYTSYIFPDYSSGLLDVDCTHVLLQDVPPNFHMEMTSDIGRDINTTPFHNPKIGFAANLLNNMIVRVANRFYRIGKYLKLAAEGLLDLPGEEGEAVIDTYDENNELVEFSSVEFYQTSGYYIDVPGNYLGFFNISDYLSNSQSYNGNSNASFNSSGPGEEEVSYSISGRLSNLKTANISFGKPLEIELRAFDNEPFKGVFIDGDDYAIVDFSNIPGYIKIENMETSSYYSTIDPNLKNHEGTVLEEFEFTTKIEDQLMNLKIDHIPTGLEFNRESDIISLSINENEYIKDLTFLITSDITQPQYQLSTDNYMFIHQNDEYITGSGKLSGIKNLTFDQSDNGYLELNLDKEIPLQVMLVNNKDELTKAKVILDPIPSQFKLELPGIVKQQSIDFPDMSQLTGFVDYSQFVFTLGKMSNELIDLLGNMSQNLIDSIGNIGFNFSLSYELESFGSTLDIIAEIERGGISKSNPKNIYDTATDEVLDGSIGWTHGIVMQQDNYKDSDILRGHLYLQGMPRTAELSTHFTEKTTEVSIDFKEYNPRYDWLLLDLKGIQDRDVNVFFQKIPSNVDFKAYADLTTNLEIGGEMIGDVEITIFDAGCDFCSQELGALYINMHTYEPIQSIREVLISELPSELNIDFKLKKDMNLDYRASSEINFIYSKLSKILTDSWHHINLILHDIPKRFSFNVFSNTAFDIDEPLPLQGLPRIELETNNTDTLDIMLSLDGAAVGQRNNVELTIQNAQRTIAKLKNNWYQIKSDGLDFIRLKMTELPILDNYKINSLVLEAEDLKALIFKVNLLFGVYPYFDLGSNSHGKIEIYLDHTIEIFGNKLNGRIALIDIVYETFGGVKVPVASPMFVNSINTDLKRSQNHVIIPAVLVSLINTWYENL